VSVNLTPLASRGMLETDARLLQLASLLAHPGQIGQVTFGAVETDKSEV